MQRKLRHFQKQYLCIPCLGKYVFQKRLLFFFKHPTLTFKGDLDSYK